MDNSNNNSEHKPCVTYSENISSCRDSASNNDSHCHQDHRRDHGKRDNSRDDESQGRFHDDQQQLTPDPSASYPPNGRLFLENNHHALSMMIHNIMAAAAMNNPQWRVNATDGVSMVPNNMPSTMSMPTTQASGSNINSVNSKGEFNMIGMNSYDKVGQVGMVSRQEMVPQLKEVLLFSKGVLLPPNPNAPPPATCDKPDGCRTIFVGGLPENITKKIIREIFEKSGEIESIKLSPKRFCHILFKDPASVERALYYSSYELVIDNKSDDPSFKGRLHIDYASGLDDQHDYECYQRRLNQVACHQHEKEDYYYYAKNKAVHIGKKLKDEETFSQAANILINWLCKDCTKRNATTFYTLLHITESYGKRLIKKKRKNKKQLKDAKKELKTQMELITHQFSEVEKVFRTACLKKVFNRFTVAQRKQIRLWEKQTEEILGKHLLRKLPMSEKVKKWTSVVLKLGLKQRVPQIYRLLMT